MSERTITVAGLTFAAPSPYSAGHVLTETEANVLNQTFAENLRNNFAPKVKKAVEDAGEAGLSETAREALMAEFATYATEYTFGTSGGPRGARGPVDPVAVVGTDLAKADVMAQMNKRGLKFPKAKIAELAKALFEKREDHYRAEAEKAMKKRGGDDASFDDLFAESGE